MLTQEQIDTVQPRGRLAGGRLSGRRMRSPLTVSPILWYLLIGAAGFLVGVLLDKLVNL